MKLGITQHPDGGLYATERLYDAAITGIAGPLTRTEALKWFSHPTPLVSSTEDIEWAQGQTWRIPDEDFLATLRAAAQRKKRRADYSAKLIVWGAVIGVIIVVAILWQYSASQAPRATPTPTGSYAYRNIPMNQLSGADVLTMSFTERQNFITTERQNIHCPTGVNDNDLAIGLTQAANTAGGRSQKATQLLAALLALDGCVAG